MKIVITGSSGLVGTCLSAALASAGHETIGIDLLEGRDIRDEAVWQALPDFDGVVHLAAISRVAWGESAPELSQSINVDGTAMIMRQLTERGRRPWLAFASSREVYGNPVRPLVREDDPLLPVNNYGRTKLEGERLITAFREAGGTAAVVRLSSVYGGRQDHPDRAIPALVQRAISGEPLKLTGADHFFDFVHVEDVVTGLLTVIERLAGGERDLPTIHLVTGVATTLRDLARLAVSTTHSRSRIVEVGARRFDVEGFCGDPERARREIGWLAATDITAGVAQVAESLVRMGPLDPVAIPKAG